jgi:hypothetical protein
VRRIIIAALLLAASVQAQAIRTNTGFRANSVPRNDDGSSSLTPLGFNVNFFGRTRSHAYVNNNGNITFDAALATFTPFGLTNTQREIIAAFFADVDTRPLSSELVTYGTDTVNGKRAFGVNYINVGYYNIHADKLNSFQLILIDRGETGDGNFDIEFNYQRIAWETGDASGGESGFGGVPAAVGWSNGSGEPGTSFELDGSLQPGAFLDGGRYALNRNRLNSTVAGRYLFRARGGQVLPPLTIVTGCPLPPAVVGAPYLERFSAVGALTYNWSLAADPGASLPPGINLTPDGTFSGTPTTPGNTEFTIRLTASTEDGEQTASKRCSLNVRPPSVTITSACPMPAASVGQMFNRSLQAVGGRAPYSWSLADGSSPLPAGLSLSAAGVLSGVPREAGTTILTFRANSNPADNAVPGIKSCSLTINAALLELSSSCSLPAATLGVPYSQTLTVAGGVAPYSWSAMSPLPTGLALHPSGLISGAATGLGGSFVVRVRDARGTLSNQTCSLSVDQPLVNITTACPLPSGTVGQPYSHRINASGGSGPYTWSTLGAIPAGMSLSSDGVLSGNPGSAGPVSLRLLVTDSAGASAVSGCSLVVQPSSFNLTSCPLPNATVGVDYQQMLNVSGGTAPYIFSAVGDLPAGLTLNTRGLLKGRPREAGTGVLTLRVMDAGARTTTQSCGMLINPSPVQISGACPLPEANVGIPYLQQFTASGGTAPYRFRLDGTLPAGLQLGSDGALRGTPLASGYSSFEVEVADARGIVVPKACSIQTGLPAYPSFRLGSIAATAPPASSGPAVTFELSRPYTLPIQGEFVISTEPDTGSLENTVNRPDPRVRFSTGEQRVRFTIPAGATQASTAIASTGTVASTITVGAINLSAAGTPILTPPAPRQFRVIRAIPTITDACYATPATGPELRITGYTTTRQLNRAEFAYTANTQQTVNIDVSGSAVEYFSSDEAVRNGGAFTLTVPLTLEGSGVLQPNTLTLSNSVGVTAPKNITTCR